MPKAVRLSIFFFVLTISVRAQISPPGLDDTKIAFWSALAVSQKLSHKCNLTFYVGQSRKSDPDNYALLKKQAIYVINQETLFNLGTKYALAVCASYRIQNRYNAEEPYEPTDPAAKNEERYYLRFYAYRNTGKTKWTFSFRPEMRLYYETHHKVWQPTDEELRFRVKGQASFTIGESKKLIVANEVLSTTDHERNATEAHWGSFHFTEDRLSTYYRVTFDHLITDFGLMHQITFDGDYIVHLAVDFILTNPFSKKK
jgi:hypothetical protein